MDKQCSFCGGTGNIRKFRTGYVCEKCLDYIRGTETGSGKEHRDCSNRNVNRSEKSEKNAWHPARQQ